MTGINGLPEGVDLILSNDQLQGVRVYLTVNAQLLNDLVYLAAAAGRFAIAALSGGLPGNTPEERYLHAYGLVVKEKPPLPPGAAFMVVEVDGEVVGPSAEDRLINVGEISLWVRASGITFGGKPFLEAKAEAAFHRTVTAVSIANTSITPGFQKIQSVVYLTEIATGRRIFTISLQAFGRGTLSTGVSSEAAQKIANQIDVLAAAKDLGSVVRLLSQSFDERLLPQFSSDDDARNLLLFTLVWTSLEKMIGKIHKRYGSTDSNLRPQFSVIAHALNPDDAEVDISEFGKLYKARQDLYHRAEMANLPAQETRQLLIKYLSLHLHRAGKHIP